MLEIDAEIHKNIDKRKMALIFLDNSQPVVHKEKFIFIFLRKGCDTHGLYKR